MTDSYDVFLSYSHNDRDAAANLHGRLQKLGLSVFWDVKGIREGDLWLDRLQDAVDGCGAFVVLVGRDGVARWIGAETQAALNRYFAPRDDAQRLPIFPILLAETQPAALPAFLRLFQATSWNGGDPLPDTLFDEMRNRTIVPNKTITFEGCPFVGLNAYGTDQAHMFFGRQKETLDALACFDTRRGSPTVRWLEINGNSGCGKSSLMNAGLLPLVDQGWLWPRTGIAHWRRIGPMMPGAHPVEMLAESLARAFDESMGAIVKDLADSDDALRYRLRERKADDTAFLLAVDQFEELFTFADPDERGRFDRLLATALEDADCPFFLISTVRADFLDRFDDLPRLVAARNRLGRPWTLPPVGADGLREIIDGPARLAGLDAGAVQEAMVAEARDEPGALPLVENALHWLWNKRDNGRLSGKLFTEQGGLAGILSRNADRLLHGLNPRERDRALNLLFRMVQVDPEGRRHTRRRIAFAEAEDIAGGGERGRALITRLAGERARDGGQTEGPLRLITVTEEATGGNAVPRDGRWVNLIHETLIRSKGLDAKGEPQPYWPTLWSYIEKHKDRAARWERLQLMAREWKDKKGFSRLFGLAGWLSLFGYRGLAAKGSLERRYLQWSRTRAVVEVLATAAVLGVVGESLFWIGVRGLPFEALPERWAYKLGEELPIPELVKVPGDGFSPSDGFSMGSERDRWSRPVHPVTFSDPFWIGKYEVTFREWDACVADDGCNGYRPPDQDWGRESRPVINVSWEHAKAYVEWLSKKMRETTGLTCNLPSEAEWEYAARAGTSTGYALPAPDGSDNIGGKALANCVDCGGEWAGRQTAPAGRFEPNAWGLYDMHGNVFEWVEDCWHENYDGAPEDGQPWLEADGGDCGRRVLRGGSWGRDRDFARSANRYRDVPLNRNFSIGFRVVCSSPSLDTDP